MKNPKLHLTFQSKVGKGFVLVWSLNVIFNEIGLQIQQLTLTLIQNQKKVPKNSKKNRARKNSKKIASGAPL